MHNDFMGSANQLALEAMLARGIAAGRLLFIKRYEAGDLYAVTKTEPNAKSEGRPPFPIPSTSP